MVYRFCDLFFLIGRLKNFDDRIMPRLCFSSADNFFCFGEWFSVKPQLADCCSTSNMLATPNQLTVGQTSHQATVAHLPA